LVVVDIHIVDYCSYPREPCPHLYGDPLTIRDAECALAHADTPDYLLEAVMART